MPPIEQVFGTDDTAEVLSQSEDDVVQLFDSYCRAVASVLAGWPQWKRHSLGSVEAEDQSDAGEQMAYDALERAKGA